MIWLKSRLIVSVAGLGIFVALVGGAYIMGVSSGKEQIRQEMEKATAEADRRAQELMVENNRIRRELARKNTQKVSDYVAENPNRECLDADALRLFNLAD